MAPSPSNAGSPEHMMHKNRLQEYTQKSALPFPIYQTNNEGFQHAPKFRSSVLVDGAKYMSMRTFSHQKEAEQDAAKFAFECITKKIKDEGCHLISLRPIFCKSILHEFAAKMNLRTPTYRITQSGGSRPVFFSSLVFYGKTYTGGTCGSKKVAEQLAARTAIQSLLEDGSGTLLSQIIKSKVKLYAALDKVKNSGDSGFSPRNMPIAVPPEDSSQQLTNVPPSIVSFNSVGTNVTSSCGGIRGKRRLKNENSGQKKMRSHQ